jgi:hypothetical protein
MGTQKQKLLSQEQVEQIVLALAAHRETFTEAEAAKLVEWAENVMMDYGMLQNVLDGNLTWGWEGDGPEFSLSGLGQEAAEKILRSV